MNIGYCYRGSDGKRYVVRSRGTHAHRLLRPWHGPWWALLVRRRKLGPTPPPMG